MPQKKKTITKRKTKNSRGRNSAKSENRTPSAVYVFFVFVFAIFLYALYHDYVESRRPKKLEIPGNKEAELKEQPKKEEKKHIKPHIVQEKPIKNIPQNKAEKRTTEKAKKTEREVISVYRQKLIAKRLPEQIPEPKDGMISSHQEKKIPSENKPSTWLKAKPKVAIVIDDMGISKEGAYELLKVKANLTFSILPGQPYSNWVAIQGHKRGNNIMAHVPMEPKDLKKNLGNGALFLSMSDREIQESFNNTINSIPYVVGFNNHMGSAFTTDVNAMNAVMSATNGKNLFFLDSRTVAKSVGISVAKAKGLKAYGRDIFLDHKNNPEFIEQQWNELLQIAKKQGQAIAIGHPYKNTIAFLQKTLPSDKVDIVPVSHLRAY